MRHTLRSVSLWLEGALFTLIVPGTVTMWIPRWIIGPDAWRIPRLSADVDIAAIAIITVGTGVYIKCLWEFLTRGRGIPAPVDHPTQLLISGLYRYVRNPMYLGVLLVLFGEAALFRSLILLAYSALCLLTFNAAILLYEEPALRRKFGSDYERYRAQVGRWVPKRPPRGVSRP